VKKVITEVEEEEVEEDDPILEQQRLFEQI